jgi:elongation factor P
MDPESYEEAHIPTDLLGDATAFLQDNMTVTVDLVEGDPVGIHLPQTVVLEVVEADPVVRGQTAASSYKPARLSNGVKTSVPPFIETGEKIVVRTEDASYVERSKG